MIKLLVEAAGCKVMYLPSYSPDFSRIEKCWAWLKSGIRKLLRDGIDLHDAIDSILALVAS
jgi:transposase